MHGLFFDVQPKPGHMPHYFTHVDRLKPILAQHKGLVFLDRYRPLDDEGALLSHQLWADEAAIAGWRADATHRASQTAGRRIHFDGYRIRVGAMVAHLTQASGDTLADLPTERLLVVAYASAPITLPEARIYESVNNPGRFVTICTHTQAATAQGWAKDALAQGAEDLRIFAVERDYTLTDRAEAPNP
jgi:heme-degrading monooxygenase HmoA